MVCEPGTRTLGKELLIARILRGRAQHEIAREVGINVSVLSEIEHGRRFPNPDLERRLKEAAGWSEEISFFCANGRCTDRIVRSI